MQANSLGVQTRVAPFSKWKRTDTVREVKPPLSSKVVCAAVRICTIDILCTLTEVLDGEFIFR